MCCVDIQEAVEAYKKQNQFLSAELLEMNQLRSDDLTVNRQLTQLVLYGYMSAAWNTVRSKLTLET